MANENLDQEVTTRDYAKWVWLGIIVMFASMVVAMFIFGQNQDNTRSNVRARHILIKFNSADPSDRQRALDLVSDLRQRIVEGEDFGKLAQEYSDDNVGGGSAARGGDLGSQFKGTFEPAFEEQVWSLPVGELSEVVATQHGFHILEVLDRNLSKMDAYQIEIEKKADGLLQQ